MLLVVSSGAKAETQDDAKKDLVSILHLEATGLGTVGTSGESGDREINPVRRVVVPMKGGLNAFLDLTVPPYPGLEPKDNSRTEHRAVVGFHFQLR